MRCQVGVAEDPDQATGTGYREPPHLLLVHPLRRLDKGLLRRDGCGLARAALTNRELVGVEALGDHPDHDVAIGDHPAQTIAGRAYGQHSDVLLGQALCGVGNRSLGVYRSHAGAHRVANQGSLLGARFALAGRPTPQLG
jgi:hypothetical protein